MGEAISKNLWGTWPQGVKKIQGAATLRDAMN